MKNLFITCALAGLLLSCGSHESKPGARDSTVQQINSPAGDSSSLPHLFLDPKGGVYLSWVERNGKNARLLYSRLEGDGWGKTRTIAQGSSWFVNWADYPMMAANGRNMIAHFLQKSDTGKFTYDIMLINSADGESWGAPKVLHDDGVKAEHGFVSMLPYGDGFFVCWLDGRKTASGDGGDHGHHGEMTLRAAFLDASGAKTGEWALDERVCDCCQTSAAITSAGPVVVYRDRSGSEIRDISIVRFSEGSWTKPQPVHADQWQIEACPVNGPRMETNGDQLAVAWFSAAAKEPKVLVAFSRDGGKSFEKPVRLDEGKAIGRVDLAFVDSATVAVSWMEGPELRAALVHSDGKRETAVQIASSSETRRSGFPQLARAGERLIFAWTDEKQARIRVRSTNLQLK